MDGTTPAFLHGKHRLATERLCLRELCAEVGIPPERVLLPEIGGVMEFTRETARHNGRVAAGSILVDRFGERGAGHAILRDPEHLTDNGVVFVMVAVERDSGKLIAGPHLVAKDVHPDLQNGALREAEDELRRTLERRSSGEPQYGYVVQRAKEIVARSLHRHSKVRPLILPMLTEL